MLARLGVVACCLALNGLWLQVCDNRQINTHKEISKPKHQERFLRRFKEERKQIRMRV